MPYKTTNNLFSQSYTTPLALVVLWPAPLPPDVTFVCRDVALITWAGDKLGQRRSGGAPGQCDDKKNCSCAASLILFFPSHSKPAFILIFAHSACIKHCSTCIRAKCCIKETWSAVIISLYISFECLCVSLSCCLSLTRQPKAGTGSLVQTKELEQTNEAAYGVWQSWRKIIKFPSSRSATACLVHAPPPLRPTTC